MVVKSKGLILLLVITEVQTTDERVKLVFAAKLYLDEIPGHRLSPHISPGFGIFGRSGEAGWTIGRRGIAHSMAQGRSSRMRSQIGQKTEQDRP